MNLARMAWRYVWSRAAVTAVTLAGIALGVALISSVLTLRREARRTFIDETTVFDLVVGAKGSPLQLVLSSLYHLDIPTGNIPYTRYEALAKDRKVTAAIPIGLGDNHAGFRIVGTVPEFFDVKRRDLDTNQSTPVYHIAEGKCFAASFEVVLGADVAHRLGLRLGDTFVGAHGLTPLAGSEEHREFPYKVVGILAPSGTASDRAIFTPLDSVWKIHDRENEIHQELFGGKPQPGTADTAKPDDNGGGFLFGSDAAQKKEREVTAVLLQLRTPGMRLGMADEIRNKTESMAAIPIMEMQRLYQHILLPMQKTLLAVAWIVVVVSALSILATLIQAAERRRRDLAILRTLGAHPREIFALVLIEAILLTILGIAAGVILGHGGIALAATHLREATGIGITPWMIDKQEFQALGAVALTGIFAGIIPATLAYRRAPTDDLSAL